MFQKNDEDEALIVENGVYKPVEVYTGPDGGLYAKAKGGFVRIKKDGSTSAPSVKLNLLHREAPLWADQFGRLTATGGGKRKQVMITADESGSLKIEGPKDGG